MRCQGCEKKIYFPFQRKISFPDSEIHKSAGLSVFWYHWHKKCYKKYVQQGLRWYE